MSFTSLLNKTCSWVRRINIATGEYGEVIVSDLLIGSDVACARQVGVGNNMRQLVQDIPAGEFDKKLTTYYLFPTDIQEGDLITFEGSEEGKVRDVQQGGGRNHHLEVLVEEIMATGEDDERIG